MNEIQTTGHGKLDAPLSVGDLLGQVNLIQEVMRAVMKDGEHFGKIPGCGDKPALLQPGAQKLLVTFRLAPEYAITEKMLEKGHREYQILCTLKTIGSGSFVGQGAGSASTMEGKWRYRVAPKTLTNRPVPSSYWDVRKSDPAAAQVMLGGKGFSTKKNDAGQWMIAEGSSEKVEHDNPADYYNTVLKMGCKRALVAATLTATAASDIFTQDVEEIAENMRAAQIEAEPPPLRPSPVQMPAKPLVATDKHRAKMIQRLLKSFEAPAIQEFAVKASIILSTENAETDWPLSKVPTTADEMADLERKVKAFCDGESVNQ